MNLTTNFLHVNPNSYEQEVVNPEFCPSVVMGYYNMLILLPILAMQWDLITQDFQNTVTLSLWGMGIVE